MKVFMDDERQTPEGFDVRTFTVPETIEKLKTGQVEVLSLDHDLGTDQDGTTLVNWLEEEVFHGRVPLPKIIIHTANPVARTRMLQVAMRLWRSKAQGRSRDEHWKLRPEVNYGTDA